MLWPAPSLYSKCSCRNEERFPHSDSVINWAKSKKIDEVPTTPNSVDFLLLSQFLCIPPTRLCSFALFYRTLATQASKQQELQLLSGVDFQKFADYSCSTSSQSDLSWSL